MKTDKIKRALASSFFHTPDFMYFSNNILSTDYIQKQDFL